jgi:hypothetical protein
MGNGPVLGQWRPDPRTDLGLGYCYRCIQFMNIAVVEKREEALKGFVANFACTTAPWPMGPGVVIPLPACFPCLVGEGQAGKPGSGLVAANGRLPGL